MGEVMSGFSIVEVDGGQLVFVDASGVPVGTPTNPLKIDPTGTTTQPISASSLPLPTGAATESKQDTGNASLASIDGKVATAAYQVALNEVVSYINAKMAALGQGIKSGSIPVTIASDQNDLRTRIKDSVDDYFARVSSDGRISVSTTISVPPQTTAVNTGGIGAIISGRGGTAQYTWVIPNGVEFHLQRFAFGGYILSPGKQAQAKGEIYYQPNGNTTGEELLGVLYASGASQSNVDLDYTWTGNGTRRLCIKITNWSTNDMEPYRMIKGYY